MMISTFLCVSVWKRFLPSTLRDRRFASTPVGAAFVAGMEGNLQTFDVHCGANRCPTNTAMIALFRMILQEDIKKINVTRVGPSLTITKTVNPLMDYDAIYPLQALRTEGRLVDGMRYRLGWRSVDARSLHPLQFFPPTRGSSICLYRGGIRQHISTTWP